MDESSRLARGLPIVMAVLAISCAVGLWLTHRPADRTYRVESTPVSSSGAASGRTLPDNAPSAEAPADTAPAADAVPVAVRLEHEMRIDADPQPPGPDRPVAGINPAIPPSSGSTGDVASIPRARPDLEVLPPTRIDDVIPSIASLNRPHPDTAASPGSRPAAASPGVSSAAPAPAAPTAASKPASPPVAGPRPVLAADRPLDLPASDAEEPPPPPGLARLRTGSIPVERRLALDGTPVNSFTLGRRLFKPGAHRVRLESPKGCIEFSIDLRADETVHLIWDFEMRGWRRHERVGAGRVTAVSPAVSPCDEAR